MPNHKKGEPPCRSCATLTVVLVAVLTGVLPGGSGAGALFISETPPTVAVSSSS